VADRQAGDALGHLRKFLAAERDTRRADAQLLARFVSERDEAAFAVLVRRHGGMVHGICQSVLHSAQDAEDVCQATFLILAKKAGAIRKQNSVASWLHGVAYRLARKLKASRERMPKVLPRELIAADPMDEISWREVRQIVHEELERLPQKYRQPLILCYLEGATQEEAARQLGWTAGMLKGMVSRGRDLLRQRLTYRGLALTAPLFAGVLTPGTAGAVLAKTTAHAAVLMLSGQAVGGGISAQAVALAKGGINAMLLTKLKVVAVVLIALIVLAAGGGLAAYRLGEGDQAVFANNGLPTSGQLPSVAVVTQAANGQGGRVDMFGDPLPTGVPFRLGTTRFRHGGLVLAVAFSPDDKLVASAGFEWRFRFWDANTAKEIFEGSLKTATTAIAFAPSGKLFATATNTGEVSVWSVPEGKKLSNFKAHKKEVALVALSEQSDMVVSVAKDGTISWNDLATGKSAKELSLQGNITAAAISSDQKTLALADSKGAIYLLDPKTGNKLATLDTTRQYIAGIAFSPNGSMLASCENGYVRFWDTAKATQISKTEGAGPLFWSAAFTADGSCIYAGDQYGQLKIFDVASGKEIRQLASYFTAIRSVALSHDGKRLLASGADHTVHMWDVERGREMYTDKGHEAPVMALAMTPDGKTLVSAAEDATVRFWNLASHTPIRQVKTGGPLYCVACSPKGDVIAAGGTEETVHLWKTTTGEPLQPLSGPKTGTKGLAFSADNHVLAGMGDREIRLWEVATGQLVRTIQRPSATKDGVASSMCIAFSPDGTCLAAAGHADNAVSIYDLSQDKETMRIATGRGVTRLSFSSSGRMMITAGVDGVAQIWEIATGKQRVALAANPDSKPGFTALAITPDGQRFVTVPQTRQFRVRDAITAGEFGNFSGHKGYVHDVVFSPDGKFLYSASADTTIWVWDFNRLAGKEQNIPLILGAEDLESLWLQLSKEDVAEAYVAMGFFGRAPNQAITVIKSKLKPEVDLDKRIPTWVEELESPDFAVRQKASSALQAVVNDAEPTLRAMLATKPPLETSLRVRKILEKLQTPPPERLRMLRALEILEYIGTEETRQIVETWSHGSQDSWLTHQAKISLLRWKQAGR
jgi:RNA polymerase sigma factor (sigma-70 family)